MFKVASRFLLPTELFFGLQTLIWGLAGSGVLWHGALWYALDRADQDEVWGIVFCGLGAAMAGTATLEWFLGRADMCILPIAPKHGTTLRARISRSFWNLRCHLIGWMDVARERLSQKEFIHKFVSIRCTVAFLMMGAWIGGFALAMTSRAVEEFGAFYPSTLLYVGFSWWVYVENLRVRYALDDRYETPNLRFER